MRTIPLEKQFAVKPGDVLAFERNTARVMEYATDKTRPSLKSSEQRERSFNHSESSAVSSFEEVSVEEYKYRQYEFQSSDTTFIGAIFGRGFDGWSKTRNRMHMLRAHVNSPVKFEARIRSTGKSSVKALK